MISCKGERDLALKIYAHGTVIRVKVYEQGAKMWFMTQAENVEILELECFRKSMQENIEKMLSLYVKQEGREVNEEDFSGCLKI